MKNILSRDEFSNLMRKLCYITKSEVSLNEELNKCGISGYISIPSNVEIILSLLEIMFCDKNGEIGMFYSSMTEDGNYISEEWDGTKANWSVNDLYDYLLENVEVE